MRVATISRENRVAPELVGAEQEDAVDALPAFDAKQMPVGRDQAEQLIGIAVDEQRDRQLAARVRRVDQLERLGSRTPLSPLTWGRKRAVVEQ